MTEMMELADTDVKTAIVNIFHMFKKVEEHVSITRNGMKI